MVSNRKILLLVVCRKNSPSIGGQQKIAATIGGQRVRYTSSYQSVEKSLFLLMINEMKNSFHCWAVGRIFLPFVVSVKNDFSIGGQSKTPSIGS